MLQPRKSIINVTSQSFGILVHIPATTESQTLGCQASGQTRRFPCTVLPRWWRTPQRPCPRQQSRGGQAVRDVGIRQIVIFL